MGRPAAFEAKSGFCRCAYHVQGREAQNAIHHLAPRYAGRDFASDQSRDGGRLRILAVVGDCNARMRDARRRYLDLGPAGCPRARLLLAERGKPRSTVSDNGTGLTSNAILRWAADRKNRLAL